MLAKKECMGYNLSNKTRIFSFFIYANMEKELDQETIKEIKEQLLAQKKRISDDLSDLSRKDDHETDDRSTKFPEYGDKPDENAQEISDYSTDIMTEKVLEKSLEDTEKALERIEKGTYGTCKYCGNPIARKRLLARPTASSCISCKTELQENE
ncbi:MAG: TraR/DksA C4-type zinc finger protein [Patescibacteria group bacterium]|jgi:RNA polymerase-binding protein DksA